MGKPVSESNDNNIAFKSLGNGSNKLDSDTDSSTSKSDVHSSSNLLASHKSSKAVSEQVKQLDSNTDSISRPSLMNNVDSIESAIPFSAKPQKLSTLSSTADQHSSVNFEGDSTITTRSQSSVYEAARQLLETDKEKMFPTSLKEIERRLDLDNYKSVVCFV